MKNVSDLTVLVVDHGLFVEAAVRMAQDVKRVLYHVPNHDPFPKWNASFIGRGLDGIEVVDDIFGPEFNYIDLFFFPDIGFGELQQHLAESGKIVWGSRVGDQLEIDREYCKQCLGEVGLPVGKFRVIKGIKALREFLRNEDDKFVKVSRWRGTCESFHSKSYKDIEPKLDEIEFKLGPLKELIEFDVEDSLPNRIEIGSDSYTVEGDFPSKHLVGIEMKDAAFAGRIIPRSSMPKPMLEVDTKMSELFSQFGYRGFFSTENRIGRDGVPYMIDFCARMPNPPGVLYSEMYRNFSEIIWQGANGNIIDPEFDSEWGVQLQMKSIWADQGNWQPIDFDEKFRNQVKLTNGCRIGDQHYSVPLTGGLMEVGCVLGWGGSLDEAIGHAKKAADTVGGYSIKIDEDALSSAKKAVLEAKGMGIDIT